MDYHSIEEFHKSQILFTIERYTQHSLGMLHYDANQDKIGAEVPKYYVPHAGETFLMKLDLSDYRVKVRPKHEWWMLYIGVDDIPMHPGEVGHGILPDVDKMTLAKMEYGAFIKREDTYGYYVMTVLEVVPFVQLHTHFSETAEFEYPTEYEPDNYFWDETDIQVSNDGRWEMFWWTINDDTISNCFLFRKENGQYRLVLSGHYGFPSNHSYMTVHNSPVIKPKPQKPYEPPPPVNHRPAYVICLILLIIIIFLLLVEFGYI